jgi:hypothetical protein
MFNDLEIWYYKNMDSHARQITKLNE